MKNVICTQKNSQYNKELNNNITLTNLLSFLLNLSLFIDSYYTRISIFILFGPMFVE